MSDQHDHHGWPPPPSLPAPPPPPPRSAPVPHGAPFRPVPYGMPAPPEPESQSSALKLLAFFLAIIGISLVLSRVIDLEPSLTAAPEQSSVEPAMLGVADDASLVVWFWSPW